jgi:hypothetical protein
LVHVPARRPSASSARPSTTTSASPPCRARPRPCLRRTADDTGHDRGPARRVKHPRDVDHRWITKYLRAAPRAPGGQRWSTFLRNHADVTWCCDFVQRYDVFFRPVFAFFIVHLGSRRVVHVATTRSPTQRWTA